MSGQGRGGTERETVLEIIDEVEEEVLSEYKTWATRNQVAEATCARIRNRIRTQDTEAEQ